MKKNVLCFLLTALLGSAAMAQELRSPEAFLGYSIGSEFTYHHDMVAYFRHVAETSAKVELFQYGTSYERRPLLAAIVSSAENIEKLEQYRKNNLIHAGLIEGTAEGAHLPVVWLNYNIHGNEAVSMEAAIRLLHTLATDEGTEISQWLKETIVIIDPCANPDGHARYTNWYGQAKSKRFNPNPDAWEHNEPWPGGRFNHYIVDLNRDWAWQTQAENRQRLRFYQHWMPHVHIDLHEMGVNSPYFFGPSAKPFHDAITPWQREFHTLSGDVNTSYFDKEGWLFFTKEIFDLFYPSYGDTWPTFQGAIGFTYEQGGSGRAGLGVLTETKDTLTLADRIAHQYTASLGAIDATWKHRERMLNEFKKYFADGRSNPAGEYKTYLIKGTNSQGRIKALLELLDRQNIQYGYATGNRATRGFSYLENKEVAVTPSNNDIIVSTYQSHARFVNVLFEPKSRYEDSLTYDLTAWSLPYVYELEAYALKERIAPDKKEVKFAFAANKLTDAPAYAYYAEWRDFREAKLLAALVAQDVHVRFATEPFEAEGKSFGRGALVITQADNRKKADFHKLVIEAANKLEIPLTVAKTGLVESGKDLGSNSVRYIEKPKIAIINGSGTYPTAFGELWHYFEEQLEYPVTVLNMDDVNSADLSEFNTIILNSGMYAKVSSTLKDFVRDGGKVIAIGRSMSLFAGDSNTSLGAAYSKQAEKMKEENKKEGEELLRKYGEVQRKSLEKSVEGSIYKVYLDETHPLAFGDDATIHFIKTNSTPYPYLTSGWNVGVLRADSHVSGFTGNKLKKELENTLMMGVEQVGSGSVVYMADSPIFRGFWHSGKLIFANAVFFVK